MRKQAVLTVSSFIVLLAGVHMAYGLAGVLAVGGMVGVVAGLVWNSE